MTAHGFARWRPLTASRCLPCVGEHELAVRQHQTGTASPGQHAVHSPHHPVRLERRSGGHRLSMRLPLYSTRCDSPPTERSLEAPSRSRRPARQVPGGGQARWPGTDDDTRCRMASMYVAREEKHDNGGPPRFPRKSFLPPGLGPPRTPTPRNAASSVHPGHSTARDAAGRGWPLGARLIGKHPEVCSELRILRANSLPKTKIVGRPAGSADHRPGRRPPPSSTGMLNPSATYDDNSSRPPAFTAAPVREESCTACR